MLVNCEMKYAGWFSAHAGYKNHTDPVPHISFVFDSFPFICLGVNSNPSETYSSKRVSMMIRIDGYILYEEPSRRVFYCQHRPVLEPTLNRFTASRHRCCTITLLQRLHSAMLMKSSEAKRWSAVNFPINYGKL